VFVPWIINGQIQPYARSGVDAEGWLWEIERDGEARRVLVEITRTALAVNRDTLPGDTGAAIRTEGHSQIVELVNIDEPPRVIVCSTEGCRHRTAGELVN
jgi:hypothetical protein